MGKILGSNSFTAFNSLLKEQMPFTYTICFLHREFVSSEIVFNASGRKQGKHLIRSANFPFKFIPWTFLELGMKFIILTQGKTI